MIQKIQSNQSFNGLLAPYKLFTGVRMTSYGVRCPFFRKTYHPFADETLEEMSTALRRMNVYENLKIVNGKKLPISRKDYSDILSGNGRMQIPYSERDIMSEQGVIPERLYRIWVKG